VRQAVADDAAGAIVLFEGVTRQVAELDYEAYEEMATAQIERILEETIGAHGLLAAAAEHRFGAVALGAPSVIVAVSAAHRAEAFAGAREAIDRIKAEAPIWKREVSSDGCAAPWAPGTPAPSAAAGDRPAGPGRPTYLAPDGSAPGGLTHLGPDGSARMIDVGSKRPTERVAKARARLRMSPATAHAVEHGDGPKGEVLGLARIAGIQAAKQTANLIPLAHPLPLTFVDLAASVDVQEGLVELSSEARTFARTGVEMEAMIACTVAALAVYDMVKGLERGVTLEQAVLLEKRGGRSDYRLEG
jgi:cyclic pyranopterin phosphate synthase